MSNRSLLLKQDNSNIVRYDFDINKNTEKQVTLFINELYKKGIIDIELLYTELDNYYKFSITEQLKGFQNMEKSKFKKLVKEEIKEEIKLFANYLKKR